jgi:hypothetical protein
MSPNEIATLLATLLQSSGLALFLFFIFRSLKREITSLCRIIDEQSKTLDVMERRIIETEKIGSIYRHLIQELPEDLERYKTLIAKLKNEMISELERAYQRKDQELAQVTEKRLSEIEGQERIIQELPELRNDLVSTIQSIEERIAKLIDKPINVSEVSRFDFDDVFERWTDYMEERGLVLRRDDEKSGCFITSACVEARGLNDNCIELSALRWWRDSYVRGLPHGTAVIDDYYEVAPRVVRAINCSSDKRGIYDYLYKALVLKTVELIADGKKEEAFANYCGIVCDLKANYIGECVGLEMLGNKHLE